MNKRILYNTLLIFILSCISILLIKWFFFSDDVSNWTTVQNGKLRTFGVRESNSENVKNDAIQYLNNISQKVDYLTNHMYVNQIPNQEISKKLYYRWKDCSLKETSSFDNSIAYTVNKGTEIRLCIRSDKDTFEDPNTTMFVVLHELAHIMSNSYGHNEEFKTNFSYIVSLAASLDIYEPQNFSEKPRTYCNTVINTTPCSDGSCTFTK